MYAHVFKGAPLGNTNAAAKPAPYVEKADKPATLSGRAKPFTSKSNTLARAKSLSGALGGK